MITLCVQIANYFFEPGNVDDPFLKLIKTSITALHGNIRTSSERISGAVTIVF